MEDKLIDERETAAADVVRESRRILRQIQAHMTQAHRNLGAQLDERGLVQVLHHPQSTLPHLNYVAPRPNTAWIPAPQIEGGLAHLREQGRLPRLFIIEGLYPPLFAKSLRDIGLQTEREVALMTYSGGASAPPAPVKTDGLNAVTVADQDGIALWWYVWRNARYDVVANGVEPVYIGRDMREMILGNQRDIILYRDTFPIGVARLTLSARSANITAVAVLKEARTPETVKALYHAALVAGLNHGCDLVFTSGETESDRNICRKLGFVDAGSLICYAESNDKAESSDGDSAGQPAFILS